ncbi:hypothetical protein L0Y34_01095 [Candidatus Parcubacteria bacterium]|nr:hypothetical protein [Candidatus Parcubacteria bacterium]
MSGMEWILKGLKSHWPILLVSFALILPVALYGAGYRVTAGGFTQVGTLVVTGLPSGSTVYTDQARRTYSANGKATIDLLPGTHAVIVDAPDFHPWDELFLVHAGAVTELRPLLVRAALAPRKLTGEERTRAAAVILAWTLPTKEAPLSMKGGCALVYVLDNRIVAEASTTPSCAPPVFLSCETEETNGGDLCSPTIIFSPNERLESVSAFPSRDDALVIAAGGSSYVVELDPREPQYFAPLMKGPRMRSAPWSEQSIVISDTKQVYELPL